MSHSYVFSYLNSNQFNIFLPNIEKNKKNQVDSTLKKSCGERWNCEQRTVNWDGKESMRVSVIPGVSKIHRSADRARRNEAGPLEKLLQLQGFQLNPNIKPSLSESISMEYSEKEDAVSAFKDLSIRWSPYFYFHSNLNTCLTVVFPKASYLTSNIEDRQT